MAKFTGNLYKGIYHQARHEWMKWLEENQENYAREEDERNSIRWWIAKVAYEWALNGIVR